MVSSLQQQLECSVSVYNSQLSRIALFSLLPPIYDLRDMVYKIHNPSSTELISPLRGVEFNSQGTQRSL